MSDPAATADPTHEPALRIAPNLPDLARVAGTMPDVMGPPDNDEWHLLERQADALARSSLLPKALTHAKNKPRDHVDVRADVILIGLTARELKIGLVQALSKVNVIEGKPTMSAELMVALIQRAGHYVRPLDVTSEEAGVRFRRTDWPDGEFAELFWSVEDAAIAGLLSIRWEKWWKDESNQNHKDVWYLPHNVVRDSPEHEITAEMLVEYEAPEWVQKLGPSAAKFQTPWWHYRKSMLWARVVSQMARMAFADVLAGVSLTPEELGGEVDPLSGELLDARLDPSLVEILVERARALPPGLQNELKEWFNDNQAPPIGRMTNRWRDTIDELLALFEERVQMGYTEPEPESDTVDTTATDTTADVVETTAEPVDAPDVDETPGESDEVAPPPADGTEPFEAPETTAEPVERTDEEIRVDAIAKILTLDDALDRDKLGEYDTATLVEYVAQLERERDEQTDDEPVDDDTSVDLPAPDQIDAMGGRELMERLGALGGSTKRASVRELRERLAALVRERAAGGAE